MTVILRDCPNCPDPCNERHKKIWDLLYRIRDAAGGIKGLVHRYAEQIAPGAQGPGTAAWRTHEQAYYNDRRGLRTEVNRYRNSRVDNGRGGKDPCPDTPLLAAAEEWMNKPAPTAAEWQANNPAQMSKWERVGWGVLGVGGIVVTGIAILSPFEGPAGDIAAGAATVEAWRRAIFGARAIAAVAP
jgi:hypothetical protein